MKKRIDNIVEIVAQKTKIDISVFEQKYLERAIANRIADCGLATVQDYINLFQINEAEPQKLLNSLTNTHSEFFRNSITFAVLEHYVLPKILRDKVGSFSNDIRIWSAGCSGGQEPYSVALILSDYNSYSLSNPVYRIFATDKCLPALESARKGVYDYVALQKIPFKYVVKNFTKLNELYSIGNSIKDMVDFSFYDILDSRSIGPPTGIFTDFDIILCCNVLFYYNHETQLKILNKFWESLNKKGIFITGEAESSILANCNNFKQINSLAPIYEKI